MKSNISWFSPAPRQWEGLDYRYERFHFLIEQRDHYELGTIYELVIQNSHDDTYGITINSINYPNGGFKKYKLSLARSAG